MSAAAAASLLRLSSTLKMEEETINMKKQGIGSILGSDSDQRSKSSSLRRTLSADHMSSTKWLAHHGFSPMKKIASSEEFSVSSITDSEREDDEDEEEEEETQTQFDIWNSIQKDKNNKDLDLEKPYIHPLVKRSSSLSEKSLEICTESLGSETGSDVFSSYPSSETEDDKEINEQQQQQQQQQQQAQEMSLDVEEVHVHIPKYNYVVGNKKPCSQSKSFPPPIPSLLSREDGASIRMQSRRDNGRLVLEAVSVPTTNNFKAQRHDGRLVLTFIETHEQQLSQNYNYQEEEEEEDVFDNFDEEEEESEDDEEEEENKEMEFVMERAPKVSTGVISLHRLTFMIKNKHLGVLPNKNPTWPNKFNEVAKFDDEEEILDHDHPTMVAQSLPPMARLMPKPPVKATTATAEAVATKVAVTGGAASLNAYEYYWRKPESKVNNINGNKLIINSKNPMENYEQRRSSTGNKGGDYLVPLLKSCKEPRRSLVFWEPHCIATS
ncbi:hypothetical protein Dsin_019633 [Dipteronia sinensis]|uniref:FAF domain-containing protein n=1 Tax=Dipteronia sinensis TaxID=43782 RepID=A0AAE0E2P7_9ROSI|nr:hypothetical protein Dsin_019633 [Dipteronia sinensis]